MKFTTKKLSIEALILSLICISVIVNSKDLKNIKVDSPEYIALSAADKMDLLWNLITSDTTSQEYPKPPTLLKGMINLDMSVSLNHDGDMMPAGRKKFIHSKGAVAKVKWVPNPEYEKDNRYTGLYKGCDNMLLRFSLAKKPRLGKEKADNPSNDDAWAQFVPGFGLKCLIDGKKSQNFVNMPYDFQKSWSFFENDYSNMITDSPKGGPAFIAGLFSRATPHFNNLGLSPQSKIDQKGNEINDNDAKFPFRLYFDKKEEQAEIYKDSPELISFNKGDFITPLTKIQKGRRLFTITAQNHPVTQKVPERQREVLGYLVLTEPFTPSKWADEKLFFKHNDWKYDIEGQPFRHYWLKARPTYSELYPKKNVFYNGLKKVASTISTLKGWFEWILKGNQSEIENESGENIQDVAKYFGVLEKETLEDANVKKRTTTDKSKKLK